MKCGKKTEVASPESVVMKNGRAAIKGTCSVCGTKVFKITGQAAKVAEAPAAPAPSA